MNYLRREIEATTSRNPSVDDRITSTRKPCWTNMRNACQQPKHEKNPQATALVEFSNLSNLIRRTS